MRLKVTDDRKFLQVIDSTQNELEQLEFSFTKKIDNYFIIKKKVPHWDGEVKFIDKYNRVPIGLWMEIKKLADQFMFHLEIDGVEEFTSNSEYDPVDFEKWTKEYFSKTGGFFPRDYQMEACRRVFKYRLCTEEISTSGGKTLISFLLFKYLFDKGFIKKMLYVVPNISLVTQTEEKFYEYEEKCKRVPNWESKCVHSGAKEKNRKYSVSKGEYVDEDPNIVFGTFQSLSKRSDAYFSEFDAVCIDETHHAKANSIKTILIKTCNAKYKFGLTGTLPKEGTCDSFMIQAYLGPKVYDLSSADLISEGNATPVHVIGLEMNYLDEGLKKKLFDLRNVPTEQKDGSKLLNLEKDTARDNRKRFNYVCQTIAKSTKNSLVLFGDIKNGYGRSIYDWLRENTEQNAYYIDGGTSPDNREYYKKRMEEDENVILVASVGTFSEGIDILNLHNIYIVETSKSEYIVRQILGRGMRLMSGKEKIQVIDFSDNFMYGSGYQRNNYLIRHSLEREKIYKEKKFPFKRFKIIL